MWYASLAISRLLNGSVLRDISWTYYIAYCVLLNGTLTAALGTPLIAPAMVVPPFQTGMTAFGPDPTP